MNNFKWYKNPEMIIGLSALLIGIVTASASIYSAHISREYARASVWPRLEIFRNFNNNSFSYSVNNTGTGPALIKYVKIKNGSIYIKEWSEIEQFKNLSQSQINHRSLSPQKSITPIFYEGEDSKAILKIDDSISIEMCYCSIYEECWVIDRDNRPTEVDACSIDEKQMFLQ